MQQKYTLKKLNGSIKKINLNEIFLYFAFAQIDFKRILE